MVNLGTLKLPPVLEKQVETDIRSVVLRAIAQLDPGGRSRFSDSIFDNFGRTLGLWWDRDSQPTEDLAALGIADHTIIVEAIMDNALPLVKILKLQPRGPMPEGFEVLDAALGLDTIDPYVKERIQLVLDVLPAIEAELTKAPPRVKRALTSVGRETSGRSIEDQIGSLRDPDLQLKAGAELAGAMTETARLLEHGMATIYAADHSFYQVLRQAQPTIVRKDAVDTVKDADAIGATGGGFAGTIIPGVGTAAGAAAGGAGASAGAALAEFALWLFD